MQNFHYKARTLLVIAFLFTVLFTSRSQTLKTEILWDTYGVPHIYGRSIEEMYYAYGWSQMQSHANLILRLYGQARGRSAEYWGKEYINSDKQIQVFNLPQLAKKKYAAQRAEYKSSLDAFVEGLNGYAVAHPGQIGKEFQQVLPVMASHHNRVINIPAISLSYCHKKNSALRCWKKAMF